MPKVKNTVNYAEAEKQLRDLADTGMSPAAAWAVIEIDKLREKALGGPDRWAVWMSDGVHYASFDALLYDYREDDGGDLRFFAIDGEAEVARFADGKWDAVVRLNTVTRSAVK